MQRTFEEALGRRPENAAGRLVVDELFFYVAIAAQVTVNRACSIAALRWQTRSKRDYNRYDMALPGGDKLNVETAVITPASPASCMSAQSFVGEYCDLAGLHGIAEEYGLGPFEVNASSMERTFCDKAFALCDYYLSGEELRRHSRHIYDLRKLQDLVCFDEALAALFVAVRKQRLGKPRCPSADPGVDLAAALRELAENDVYRRDYIDVTTDLLYDDMPYEEAVKVLSDVSKFVDGIDWDL